MNFLESADQCQPIVPRVPSSRPLGLFAYGTGIYAPSRFGISTASRASLDSKAAR